MRKAARFFIGVLMFCAIAIFSTTIVRAFFFYPDTEVSVPAEKQAETNPLHHPVRVQIPKLGIDAKVQEVGVTVSGNMGVPSNFTDVGWYKYGVAPGGTGSAVIAGHVDNGLGLSGVFKKLGDLQEGDEVIIERKDGKRLTFIVTEKRSYQYNEVPTGIVFNPAGSTRLNLITCEGSWVKSAKTYDQRLVVFTKLEGS